MLLFKQLTATVELNNRLIQPRAYHSLILKQISHFSVYVRFWYTWFLVRTHHMLAQCNKSDDNIVSNSNIHLPKISMNIKMSDLHMRLNWCIGQDLIAIEWFPLGWLFLPVEILWDLGYCLVHLELQMWLDHLANIIFIRFSQEENLNRVFFRMKFTNDNIF